MKDDTKKELIVSAIKMYCDMEQKNKDKKIFHNTELLLRNYNKLVQHADNAVYGLERLYGIKPLVLSDMHGIANDDDDEDFDVNDILIASILKTKARTALMIAHIDTAIEQLRFNAIKEGYHHKVEAMVGMYVKGLSAAELAEELNSDSRTIYRWKKEALRELSILLFGTEALNLAV